MPDPLRYNTHSTPRKKAFNDVRGMCRDLDLRSFDYGQGRFVIERNLQMYQVSTFCWHLGRGRFF